MVFTSVTALVRKELIIEWRQKSAIAGILLYLASTVFTSYLAFEGVIGLREWNSLFWLIMLFASINSVMKSFIQESRARHLYYYTLVSATEMIIAKLIYNAAIMLVLGVVGFIAFMSFMGIPIGSPWLFFLNMILGMTGFASILTLISAIAARAGGNFTLMAVLGFPLVLPLLLLLIGVSVECTSGTDFTLVAADMLITALLVIIGIILSVLLFPYIWRE